MTREVCAVVPQICVLNYRFGIDVILIYVGVPAICFVEDIVKFL